MSDIKVAELEAAVEAVFEQRETYEEAKRKSGEEWDKLNKVQGKAMSMLEELELTSYKSKVGSLSYSMVESFKVPKDTESREKFFSFLKEKGVYESMVTVNSRTLNAFAKAEVETSNELDYQIPGLVKSDPMPKVTLRRAK